MLRKSKEKYVDTLLRVALESDNLDMLLLGDGLFEVKSPQGMNVPMDHDNAAVMDAIYRRYNSGDKEINIKVQKTLEDIFDNYLSIKITNALKSIEYQMHMEKANEAPFKLDCQTLLMKARDNFIRNKELFSSPKYGIWEDIEATSKDISNNFGHKVL